MQMDEKTLELKSVYELSPEELEELDLKEGDELSLFEGDPDYMVTPEGECIYFFIWSDKNLVVTSDYSDYDSELLEFCAGQDTQVSLGGWNTRSETGRWEYMEHDSWDGFEKNWNLKIAYRGGCGYCYTLFEYVN